MSSPSSIASSSNGRLDTRRSPTKVMNSPGIRRHSTSPQRGRYELARRPSDPERPHRDYSPSRRQYPPWLGHGNEQSSIPTRSENGQSPQDHSRAQRGSDLRVDTQMDGRARDGSHTMSAAPDGSQAERDSYQSPPTPYSSGGHGPSRRQNHAQRRTAKWKAGGSKRGGNYNNNQQRQYQNRKPYNRNQPKSAQDDIRSSKSSATPLPPSPSPNTSSPFDQYTNLSSIDLDHAKDLVLDLLGWGVPPQHLLDRGVSPQLMHRVFTDLQLQLPQDFVPPLHTSADTPVLQT
ncbi:hypothetical protein FA13DRAFT_225067 [Coprinellus micaceus]|uniref:Uncharacterized protein n=1 Tax=Coprinellus micaceus TaxID=71717 RepID=A0A4Y7TF30_COPMI|nr:hypothetical protein FA13DRAFT_225067 [Coprinellus micaceus]